MECCTFVTVAKWWKPRGIFKTVNYVDQNYLKHRILKVTNGATNGEYTF